MLGRRSTCSAARRRLAPAVLWRRSPQRAGAPAAAGARRGAQERRHRRGPTVSSSRRRPSPPARARRWRFHADVSDRADGARSTGRGSASPSPKGARRLGDYRATGFGGVYSLLVPIPSADGWRSLRFALAVAGPARSRPRASTCRRASLAVVGRARGARAGSARGRALPARVRASPPPRPRRSRLARAAGDLRVRARR